MAPHLGYLPVISLPSAWQHPALTKSRHQAELSEMRSRSVLQRLRAVFVAD